MKIERIPMTIWEDMANKTDINLKMQKHMK